MHTLIAPIFCAQQVIDFTLLSILSIFFQYLSDKPSLGKRSKPVSMTPRSSNGNVVNSKILGKFAPKAVAVGALSPQNTAGEEDDEKMEKIVRMMTKAINIK